MMEQIHKDALRRTRVLLVQDLSIDGISDYLQSYEIFTPLMMEYILVERTRIEKVRKLLDDLPKRGPKAYHNFLLCLRQSKQEHLAKAIEEQETLIKKEKGFSTVKPEHPVNEGNSALHISSSFESSKSSSLISSFNVTSNTSDDTTLNLNAKPTNSQSRSNSSLPESPGGKKPRTSKDPDEDSLELLIEEMDYEDQVDSATEARLLSDADPPSQNTQTVMPPVTTLNEASTTMPNQTSEPIIRHPVDDSSRILDTTSLFTGHPVNDNRRVLDTTSVLTSHPVDNNGRVSNSQSAYESHRSKSYKMDSEPRGLALIINNQHFDQLPERIGTQRDSDSLRQMFYKLGCGVRQFNDVTRAAMEEALSDFATNHDLHRVDCIFVVLLSHGKDNEGVYGVDGQEVSVQRIFEMFSAAKCPAMRGKPKMFIINACRGDMDGSSIPLDRNVNNSTSMVIQSDKVEKDSNPVRMSTKSLQQVVNHQDMVAAYSTFPGHVSYRNTAEGSWFIQDLVQVFTQQWRDEHVTDLLTDVNRTVSERRDEDNDIAQIPFPANSLTKKWYLNPPQH